MEFISAMNGSINRSSKTNVVAGTCTGIFAAFESDANGSERMIGEENYPISRALIFVPLLSTTDAVWETGKLTRSSASAKGRLWSP